MQIRLPTSSEALLGQVRIHREIVQEMSGRASVNKYKLIRQMNDLIKYDFEFPESALPYTDILRFLLTFNHDAELARLDSLELALKSGVKSLQFT